MSGSVLVVEDDDDLREMFAEVLRDAGYAVQGAENGSVALELLEERGAPCVVLLDLMMPVMSGAELLKHMKHSNRLSALPVIVLSAGGRPSDVPDASEFLRKPVGADELLKVVERYCVDVRPLTTP